MKVIVLLLLMAACHGIPLDIQKAPQLLLPIPKLKRMESKDDPHNPTIHREIVTWSTVESGDPDNPILGYKLKVWTIPKIKKTVYKLQGDEVVRVLEESYPKIDRYVIPDGVPQVFVTPADVTTATVQDVHEDVAYQFAVQAFTAQGDGPLSEPTRIRLIPKHEENTNGADLLGKKETRY